MVAVALSGCVGDQAGDPADAASGPGDVAGDDTGTIVGVVVDDSLTPVAGVQVALLDEEGVSAVTDDVGNFKFTGLAPGSYSLAVQKLGFDSAVKKVSVQAGQTADVQFTLQQVRVLTEAYTELLIGDGYFACGAYIPLVVTWGNLHACVWDEHKPRFFFEADKAHFMGILQEVVWEQNTALTAKKLLTSIQYKPVCDPFCSNEESWAGQNSESPARAYIDDMEDFAEDVEEDPLPLASMTFPGGDPPSTSPPSAGSGPVIVFQQRMTHYITLFYGEHGSLEVSSIPDA